MRLSAGFPALGATTDCTNPVPLWQHAPTMPFTASVYARQDDLCTRIGNVIGMADPSAITIAPSRLARCHRP